MIRSFPTFLVLAVWVVLSPAAVAQDILLSPEAQAARRYVFSAADEALLDEIQLGCFQYLWREVGSPAPLVRDRLTTEVSSTAAVGFQLSALPIGVERGWVSRAEAEARAVAILKSLIERDDNKKFGVYLHFVDRNTGGLDPGAPEVQTSTVDHALLVAGAIPAAMYFGGEVRTLTDRLVSESDWKTYAREHDGLLSHGWRSSDIESMDAPGEMRPWKWHVASAEEFLMYLLAAGSPEDDHAVPADSYYKLERHVAQHASALPYVVSWNGTMFTYFFQHCWINYGQYEADEPAKFGSDLPRVNWFENTRRAYVTHRERCIEKSGEFGTLGPNRWGIGPCMGLNEGRKTGYLVQDMQPNMSGIERWRGGTVAPYVTASALPFMPAETLDALREMRELRDDSGKLLVWRSPEEGGYGFLDSFNLDQMHAAEDYVGIDVGPMLLLIENARTGMIWNLFHAHPQTQRAVARLGWKEQPPTAEAEVQLGLNSATDEHQPVVDTAAATSEPDSTQVASLSPNLALGELAPAGGADHAAETAAP